MLDKIYFNDVEMPNFLILKDIQIQLLGDVHNTLIKSNYGSRHKKIEFGSKKIKLEFGTLFEKENMISKEQLNEITTWIKGDNWKPSKLVLPNSDIEDPWEGEYYMAIVNNSGEIKNDIIEGIFVLEFICLNPNRFADNENKIKFPNRIGNELKRRIFYDGTASTYPVIQFDVSSRCSELKLSVSNSKYDNYIRFKGDFNAGETIEIDMRSKKVLRNNNVAMQILTLDSRFHEIVDGNNIYSLDAGSATVEVKYRCEFM